MRYALLAGLVLILAGGRAEAQFYTGDDVFRLCTMPEDQSRCTDYMSGVTDSFDLMDRLSRSGGLPPLFCLNGAVSALELRDVVLAYMQDHKAESGQSAADLILSAVRSHYPCKS